MIKTKPDLILYGPERMHAINDEEIERFKKVSEERAKSPIKVRMIQTKKGSPDGIRVIEYQKGEIYDLPASLAEVFLREGWAKKIQEVKK